MSNPQDQHLLNCVKQFPCPSVGFNQNLYNCCINNADSPDDYNKCRIETDSMCGKSRYTRVKGPVASHTWLPVACIASVVLLLVLIIVCGRKRK